MLLKARWWYPSSTTWSPFAQSYLPKLSRTHQRMFGPSSTLSRLSPLPNFHCKTYSLFLPLCSSCSAKNSKKVSQCLFLLKSLWFMEWLAWWNFRSNWLILHLLWAPPRNRSLFIFVVQTFLWPWWRTLPWQSNFRRDERTRCFFTWRISWLPWRFFHNQSQFGEFIQIPCPPSEWIQACVGSKTQV